MFGSVYRNIRPYKNKLSGCMYVNRNKVAPIALWLEVHKAHQNMRELTMGWSKSCTPSNYPSLRLIHLTGRGVIIHQDLLHTFKKHKKNFTNWMRKLQFHLQTAGFPRNLQIINRTTTTCAKWGFNFRVFMKPASLISINNSNCPSPVLIKILDIFANLYMATVIYRIQDIH